MEQAAPPANNPETCVPLQLADVLADELIATKEIHDVNRKNLDDAFKKLHKGRLTALCFSGGGIRSATFGLGIVQALARHKLLGQFDYLSTVSGGGYLGSWLSAWVYREQEKNLPNADRNHGINKVQDDIDYRETPAADDPNPEPAELQHLREYSNYMSPRTGLLSADTWTLVAIYLRNLLLTLLISIPLLTAALMLPRFLFRELVRVSPARDVELWTLIVAAALASFAVAFVISRLPSKTHDEDVPVTITKWQRFKSFLNTDAGVLIFGVLPLLIAAFLATTLWGWKFAFGSRLDDYYIFSSQFGDLIDPSLGYFLAGSVTAYFLGLVIFFIIKFRKAERDLSAGFAALVSSLIGGLLIWIVAFKLLPYALDFIVGVLGPDRIERYIWQIYLSFAVPIFLLIVLAAASIFVGLTSRTATDEDREWLARYGAWVVIVGAVWAILNSLVLVGPSLLQWIFRIHWTELFSWSGLPAILSSVGAIVSGAVALLGGYSEKGLVRDEPVKSKTSTVLAYAPRIAAGLFLIFIFIGIGYLGSWILFKSGISGKATFDHVTILQETSVFHLVLLFAILGAIGLLMACFVNVNKFSLHGAYRDRLVRAYLGASHEGRKQNTFTGFDDNDNLELHQLANQKPLHIINATVNLVAGKNLAWQDRKAASFTMSALHCGSWAVKGYRRSEEYCRSASGGKKALRLGTAMAISGAAANPNMGYYSSSVVTFLMSLFNIRLGWWLGNTGEPGSGKHWFGLGKRRFYEKVGPSIAVLPMINETFGRTDEKKRFLMVTDGGHFENLAVYEMVLRRCRLIFLSDGAADASFKFGEIANAIQKCKVDLGVDIKFVGSMSIYARESSEELRTKGSRFAIAMITYPEIDPATGRNQVGFLLYMRPTYYGITEPRDIRYYAEANRNFPHQSTGDQMYDEKQFEAYRGLGFLTMEEVIKLGNGSVEELEDIIRDELIILAKADLVKGRGELATAVGDFLGEEVRRSLREFTEKALSNGQVRLPPWVIV